MNICLFDGDFHMENPSFSNRDQTPLRWYLYESKGTTWHTVFYTKGGLTHEGKKTKQTKTDFWGACVLNHGLIVELINFIDLWDVQWQC